MTLTGGRVGPAVAAHQKTMLFVTCPACCFELVGQVSHLSKFFLATSTTWTSPTEDETRSFRAVVTKRAVFRLECALSTVECSQLLAHSPCIVHHLHPQWFLLRPCEVAAGLQIIQANRPMWIWCLLQVCQHRRPVFQAVSSFCSN